MEVFLGPQALFLGLLSNPCDLVYETTKSSSKFRFWGVPTCLLVLFFRDIHGFSRSILQNRDTAFQRNSENESEHESEDENEGISEIEVEGESHSERKSENKVSTSKSLPGNMCCAEMSVNLV